MKLTYSKAHPALTNAVNDAIANGSPVVTEIAPETIINTYEAKQEAKRARLELAADRAEVRSNAAYARADMRESASGIPLGQPILVGHHSEGRHRAAIKRADNAMRASIDADKRAGELRARAAAVGSGGISSDDPDAVSKLQAKIDSAEASQDFMKKSNRIVKKAVKDGIENPESKGWAGYMDKLNAMGDKYNEAAAEALLKPDFCGRIGFASYQLTNNNANIRRMKERVAQLEATSEAESNSQVYQGVCEVVENVDENRLQFLFDGKPSADVRKIMKSHGFRWAPSQSAWQRQLTNNARWSGKQALRALGVES